MTAPDLNKIETVLTLIPGQNKSRVGELFEIMQKLGQGHIGDSFVTHRSTSTCIFTAKMMGGKVICRCFNPMEKDSKKKLWRVWRSDGKSLDEVNEIIQRRKAGEDIPKPTSWKQLTLEEMNEERRKKWGDANKRVQKNRRPIEVPRT